MRENAVALKEIRSVMRGGRAFSILTIYLGFLAFFALAVFNGMASNAGMGGSSSFYIGGVLFSIISFAQLAMTSFIAPSLTAGSFSREREQQTYDLLVLTKMSPLSLVVGKLISATMYAFLLILASLPIASIVFLLGGVSVWDFLLTYLLMIITTVFFAAIGVFFSAISRNTRFSSVLSSAFVLAVTLGIPIFTVFVTAFLLGPNRQGLAEPLLHPVLILNQFVALASILAGSSPNGSMPTSATLFSSIQGGVGQSAPLAPDWVYTMIVYAILTVILLLATSRLIKPLGGVPRITRGRRRKDNDTAEVS
jgi:ABC-2 type transport system permease protein